METSVSLKHPGFLGFCCSETGSATSLAVKKGEADVREEPDRRGFGGGALTGSVRRPDHGLEDSRWSGSAVDTAEPANGLRMYPESVLAHARAIFGARVPRRRKNSSRLLGIDELVRQARIRRSILTS